MNFQKPELLKRLGIQTWRLRTTLEESSIRSSSGSSHHSNSLSDSASNSLTLSNSLNNNLSNSLNQALNNSLNQAVNNYSNESCSDSFHSPSINSSLENDLNKLRLNIAKCTACDLHKTRTQTVFGVGNPTADLMLIGEAPGFYEDQKGEPFVGRAGQLLNAMLQAIGLDRNQVFIANILKCRPPNNRDPSAHEVSQCTLFLEKQIHLIKPKLLLALGRIAAHYLLNNKTSLTQLRGKIYSFGNLNTPLIVTYHPAYLLRNPQDKGKAFCDLQMINKKLRTLIQNFPMTL